MKTAVLTLLAATALAGADVPVPKEEWSETVDGVRGRLLIEFGPDHAGAEMAVVYLELQNVSKVANPKEIWRDTMGGQFTWQLVDERGNPVPPPGAIMASILTPPPYWIALPHDSTLRFRVSIGGYGIKRDGGIVLPLPGALWQMPRKREGGYYLSGTFTGSAPDDVEGKRPWKGVLVLPKVVVPEKGK